MRRLVRSLTPVLLSAASAAGAQPAPPPPPTVVSLGSCTLERGAVIPDCRIAYRSFGQLVPDRGNVVLVPTFFAGRSEDHLFMLGTYLDTLRHHVIIVDALADGRSSSPSNAGAAASAFDSLTIGDMVEAQRRLLQERLGVTRLRAVVGISMGGFQAFEWAVRHPGMMERVVSILGSPRVTPTDRLVYAVLRDAATAGGGDPSWIRASRVETLVMRTAKFLDDSGSTHLTRSVAELASAYRASGWSPADYAAQLGAMSRADVASRLGDIDRAARAVRARMLVVATPGDLIVSPAPALDFAARAGARTLVVPSDCGHAVFWCEADRIGASVRTFLAEP